MPLWVCASGSWAGPRLSAASATASGAAASGLGVLSHRIGLGRLAATACALGLVAGSGVIRGVHADRRLDARIGRDRVLCKHRGGDPLDAFVGPSDRSPRPAPRHHWGHRRLRDDCGVRRGGRDGGGACASAVVVLSTVSLHGTDGFITLELVALRILAGAGLGHLHWLLLRLTRTVTCWTVAGRAITTLVAAASATAAAAAATTGLAVATLLGAGFLDLVALGDFLVFFVLDSSIVDRIGLTECGSVDANMLRRRQSPELTRGSPRSIA